MRKFPPGSRISQEFGVKSWAVGPNSREFGYAFWMRSFKARKQKLELQRLRQGHVQGKNLPISDAPRACGPDNAVRHLDGARVTHPDVDFDLGQKRHAVLAADVAVEVALLAAVALGFADHASNHVRFRDGAQYRFGAKRFDDDGELLHDLP